MAACRGDQEVLGVVLSFDIDEVFVNVEMLGAEIVKVDRFGVHLELSGEKANGLGEATDRKNIEPFDHSRLCGIGRGHQQAIAPFGNGLDGHPEYTFDRLGFAGEGRLAENRVVAGPVAGDLAAGHQQPQRNRQIEAVGILLEIGRSCACKAERCERSSHALVFAFLTRSYPA